jgi:hypothetical protein
MISLTFSDGTILATAGSKGSTKTVEAVSEQDQKLYVDRGRVSVVDVSPTAPAPSRQTPPRTAAPKEKSE